MITPASAKQKGRELQQWVCRRISQITGYEWGSSGQDQPIESRPMGQNGPDVRMESHVLREFPYTVECKRMESWAVHQWIDQAQSNRIPETDWLVIAKRSRRRPVVIMDAETFFQLVEREKQQRTDG